MGLADRDIADLNKSLFNTGRALGLSLDTLKAVQQGFPDLADELFVFGPEAVKHFQTGILRVTKAYEGFLGNQEDAATQTMEFLRSLRSEEGLAAAQRIASTLGVGVLEVQKLVATDPARVVHGQLQTVANELNSLFTTVDATGRRVFTGLGEESIRMGTLSETGPTGRCWATARVSGPRVGGYRHAEQNGEPLFWGFTSRLARREWRYSSGGR